MFANFDFDVIWRSLPYLFYQGMTFTLLLTALATLGGIVIGTLLALMRLSGTAVLTLPAAAYVNLMRSVPFVLMIFWFYFLVPYIGQWITRSAQPLQVGAFASCLVTFTLFEAAFFCEIMRAGIQSIPRGQVAAAQALGMTYPTTMGYIVLPQAFRNMVPVLLTQTIILFQDTSLVYVISVTDFLGAASKVAERDGRLVEMYTFAACRLFRHLARRLARGGAPATPHRHHPLNAVIQIETISKWYGPTQVLKDCIDRGRQGRGRRGLRAFRLGQVDADQMRQRAGAVPERPHQSSTASRSAIPRPTCPNCARGSAWCFSISSCSRTSRSCAI